MTLFSPGIEVKEKDFSLIVPTVANGIGGIVGRFTKGPVNQPVFITNEDELVSIFGKPNDINANEWFTAAEFLKYTDKLWAVRAAPTTYGNATSSGTMVSVPNLDAYETISNGDRATAGEFIAKNAGTAGNGIGVMLIDSATWDEFNTWNTTNAAILPVSLASYFAGAPSTTEYVASRTVDTTAKLDEIYVLVLDISGKITGKPYSVLEKYDGLSKASDAVDYKGTSIYYVNVLNMNSQYVYWSNHPTATNGANDIAFGSTAFDVAPANKVFASINIVAAPNFYTVTLSGGVESASADFTTVQAAYDKLANKDLYDVNLMMAGGFGMGAAVTVNARQYYVGVEKYVAELAFTRKDCVAFISPTDAGSPYKDTDAAVVDKVIDFKTAVGISDQVASYGFMDTGMKYIYDRYNKKYRWVPLNGDMAGICARVDSIAEAWFSPGGFNRGGVKNVIKFAFNPNQAKRDVIYPKGINPVIFDSASGPVLFGDRTMTSKPSAFDRINVRRLFIILEKAISIATKWQLFEFNDTFTRAQFKNMVEPFLRNIQGRRGITDFLVICDATNNTGQVIDSNQFVADIYIKPARSINFITLNFVATRTDVSFSTLVQ